MLAQEEIKPTAAERGRSGGLTAAARMTPEQRKERSRRAYLAGAVRAVVMRSGELTDEDRCALRKALGGDHT